MSYYSREEQETLYSYDPINGNWRIYSTYPPHIRKLLQYAHVINAHKDSEERVIAVEGIANANQIRLFKPRL